MLNRLHEAPTLTPAEALMAGSAVLVGGVLIFALMLLIIRRIARR